MPGFYDKAEVFAHAVGLGSTLDATTRALGLAKYRTYAMRIGESEKDWVEKCYDLQQIMNGDIVQELRVLAVDNLKPEDCQVLLEVAAETIEIAVEVGKGAIEATAVASKGLATASKGFGSFSDSARRNYYSTMSSGSKMIKKISSSEGFTSGTKSVVKEIIMSSATSRYKLDVYKRLINAIEARPQIRDVRIDKDFIFTAYSYCYAAVQILATEDVEGDQKAVGDELNEWYALLKKYENLAFIQGGKTHKTRKNKKKRRYTR